METSGGIFKRIPKEMSEGNQGNLSRDDTREGFPDETHGQIPDKTTWETLVEFLNEILEAEFLEKSRMEFPDKSMDVFLKEFIS